MSRDTWDAVLASTPLNGTAGRVTSKGVHFEPRTAIPNEVTWDAPPPLARITPTMSRNASFVDLTGRSVGRLTVLGLTTDGHKEARGGVWACRCVCGKYVGRRAKSLKATEDHMCNDCRLTATLRKAGSSEHARRRAEAPEARKW